MSRFSTLPCTVTQKNSEYYNYDIQNDIFKTQIIRLYHLSIFDNVHLIEKTGLFVILHHQESYHIFFIPCPLTLSAPLCKIALLKSSQAKITFVTIGGNDFFVL